MTILEQLADHARVQVAAAKEKAGLDTLQAQCRSLERTLGHGQGRERFQKALSKPGLSFLCELKKASPSKGLIDPEFPYLDIAKEYEAAGADAISCLTEPQVVSGLQRHLPAGAADRVFAHAAQGLYRGPLPDL